MNEELQKAMTAKEAKKENMRRKRQLRKEREIRKFCKDIAKEDLLFRFMKKFSMNESMALRVLKEYHIDITKKQIAYARKKKKEIRANNKRKNEAKKKRKQQGLLEKEYQEYKEDVCRRFMETGQVYTLEAYAIIKEEFF